MSGSAEGSFNLHVSGVPGPPTAPLEASQITGHTCHLTWNPPQTDGGSRVTHYVVERRDLRHDQWITVSSFCKSTSFTVQGLSEGQTYDFRVRAANANGVGPPLAGANPVKAKAPFDVPSAPGTPQVTEVGGDFVHLEWERSESDGGSRIKVKSCLQYSTFGATHDGLVLT